MCFDPLDVPVPGSCDPHAGGWLHPHRAGGETVPLPEENGWIEGRHRPIHPGPPRLDSIVSWVL